MFASALNVSLAWCELQGRITASVDAHSSARVGAGVEPYNVAILEKETALAGDAEAEETQSRCDMDPEAKLEQGIGGDKAFVV